jgi:thiol-disulfide isomerase/thioredoxin
MKQIVTVLILLFSLVVSAQAESEQTFSVTDINGKVHQFTGTKEGLKVKGAEGKVVFLEFFGHMCPPCKKSIPHLIHLQKKYKDKLAIIAIEVQGLNSAQLKAFAEARGINYTVISDSQTGSFTNYIAQRADWRGSIPFMIILDTKGDVKFIQPGLIPEAVLENAIKEISGVPAKAAAGTAK